jgi:hypothetical protein
VSAHPLGEATGPVVPDDVAGGAEGDGDEQEQRLDGDGEHHQQDGYPTEDGAQGDQVP